MKKTGTKRACRGIGRGILLLLLTVPVLFAASCRQAGPYEHTGFAMGSVMRQTLYGSGGETAAANALSCVQETENRISWKIGTSEIARLNENAGKGGVGISSKTAELLLAALDAAQRTDGAFEPAILPLSALWNFDESPEHAPEREAIEERLPLVSSDHLSVTGNTAALSQEGCGVDLGAAGKGAACDAAVEEYRKSGLEAAVVSVGGSVGVYGRKPDGSDFRISVRDPAGSYSDSVGFLTLPSDSFVSTSGDYEKYFIENGVKYSHILDPKTGYPAGGGATSVTVIAESGALSDILSTACFVLGPEKSIPVLAGYGADALFVMPDGEVLLIGNPDFTLTNDRYRVKTP